MKAFFDIVMRTLCSARINYLKHNNAVVVSRTKWPSKKGSKALSVKIRSELANVVEGEMNIKETAVPVVRDCLPLFAGPTCLPSITDVVKDVVVMGGAYDATSGSDDIVFAVVASAIRAMMLLGEDDIRKEISEKKMNGRQFIFENCGVERKVACSHVVSRNRFVMKNRPATLKNWQVKLRRSVTRASTLISWLRCCEEFWRIPSWTSMRRI